MKSKRIFYFRNNHLGEQNIEFKNVAHTTEFLKMLLQLLGMYNFMLKTNQCIWQTNQISAALTAPNGTVMLHIDSRKNISLEGFNNQKDIMKIQEILHRLVSFKKVALEMAAYY